MPNTIPLCKFLVNLIKPQNQSIHNRVQTTETEAIQARLENQVAQLFSSYIIALNILRVTTLIRTRKPKLFWEINQKKLFSVFLF